MTDKYVLTFLAKLKYKKYLNGGLSFVYFNFFLIINSLDPLEGFRDCIDSLWEAPIHKENDCRMRSRIFFFISVFLY